MNTALRVLFVEDSEVDLLLVLRELRKGGYEPTYKRVDTRPDMESALDSQAWDLIICDHAMPQFSSNLALEVVKPRDLDLPFIVVSGVAPEEVITEAMRAGAHDFISKGSLVRLVPAIQRELREAASRKERRQIEARLTESESRYSRLFNENPAPMLLVDATTLMVVDANPAAAAFFGHSLDTLKQVAIPALSNAARGRWKAIQLAKERQGLLFHDQMLLSDGSLRELDVYAVRIIQSGRHFLLATLFDQTERKLAERALSESEARFRNLADSTPMLIWTADTDARYTYFNRPWLEFRGRAMEEEKGEGWTEGIHPDDLSRCLQIQAEAFEEQKPFEMEFRFQQQNGAYRWMLNKGLPRFTQEHHFTGFAGACLDITDRRNAEASMVMLAAAVDQVSEAIAVTDTAAGIVYANKAFRDLTGLQPEQHQGWSLNDLIEQAGLRKALDQAAQGTASGCEITLPVADGKNHHMDATCAPVRNERRQLTHLVTVMRDVTNEIELERELRQAQKMDALGSLAAGIVHDSNNILTTILTAAELIKWNLPQDSPLLSKVDVILQAGLCAAGLNKQILSFSSRSDDTRLPLDLSAIVRKTLQMLRETLPQNIEVQSTLMSGVWVEGDPAQLNQIVLNLAINAVQAMQPEGGRLAISLAETLVDGQSHLSGLNQGRHALMTVKDTGCGMGAAVLERMFDPFFTTKPSGEGTGLGLSIVHATVTKAGGKITVWSEPGKGTEFRIYWPCVTGQETFTSTRLPEDVGGSESVLFVDDEELVGALAKLSLQSLGYSVTTYTDPLKAVDAFSARPNDFDLVFTDLGMPGLNGVDLATQIQKIRPGIPVLLVSGLSLSSALSINGQARFQGVVTKPFTAFDLADAARKALDQVQSSEAEATVQAPVKEPRSHRDGLILLAEDSHVTRNMIKGWLERAGCEVVAAKDGLEAWEAFSHGPDHGRFTLVLTDVVMPRMDGLELAQLVRKTDPAIPIAILTSNEDKDTVKSALNLGVNEYLNKPFEAEQLIQCIESLMAISHSRQATRRSVETAQAVRLAQKTLVAVPEKDLPLFSLYEPLTDAGGDVFRCLKCADGSILFVLADVAGHSVLSSYAVASFLAIFSTFMSECVALMAPASGLDAWDSGTRDFIHCCGLYGKIPCDPLRHLAMKLNASIQNGPFSEVPICLLLGLWNPATGRLELLNAGIPHGFLGHQADAEVTALEINGTPLGIFPEPIIESCTLQLAAGDRLLFGTDGFFDVQSPDKRSFQDVVGENWSALRESPIDWALSVICEEARGHGNGVIADDLLVIGFEQPALERTQGELVLHLPSISRAADMACDRLLVCIKEANPGRGFSRGAMFDVQLAVREALTNAMIHGNKNRPEASITLRCWPGPDPGRFVVSVKDEGPGFDLDSHVPPEDPLSERGRGISMIRAYAEDVRMTGSELTMTFQLEEETHD